MKRALHMASDVDAYARLVFYVAIGHPRFAFFRLMDLAPKYFLIIHTRYRQSVT